MKALRHVFAGWDRRGATCFWDRHANGGDTLETE